MSVNLAPSSDNLLLGKGEVFFNRRINGVPEGLRHLGNVETLEVTTTDDVLEKYSSMSKSAALLKRVTRRRDAVIRMVMDDFAPENLALALMGDVALSAAQAATPIVDEVLTTSVRKGGYYKTALMGPITAVSLEMGVTPLVAGTDYRIHDANFGIIQILPTSVTVTNGSAIQISYTPTAYSAGLTQVRGGTQTLIEGSLLFKGDPSSGPAVMVEVWSVSISPDGALGLISDEFAQMTLSGAIQSDLIGHPLEPLYRVTYMA